VAPTWQGVAWIQKEGAKCQKTNYEANNDRNLTKLTTHCLDLYQIEVWPFFRPQLPPIMAITAHIYWKWGGFLVRSEIIVKFPDFHTQILLNDFDFWQFFRDSLYTYLSGKFWNLNIFAPFGLWKSGTKKVPCPVHKYTWFLSIGFWLFFFFCYDLVLYHHI